MPHTEHVTRKAPVIAVPKAELPICPVCNDDIDFSDERLRWRGQTICLPCGVKLSSKEEEIRWRDSEAKGETAAQKCLREAGEFQGEQSFWRERLVRRW